MSNDDFAVCRPILAFILEYHERYREMPTEDIIKDRFREEWAPPAEGAFEYWAGELRKYSVARRGQLAIRDALQKFDDPDQAITDLIGRLSAIRLGGGNHIVATDAGIVEGFAKYQMRKEIQMSANGRHIFGIQTPYRVINDTFMGWMPGELIGVYARPSVGKTWVVVNEAVNAWLQGYRVLVVSPEMPTSQLNIRFWTVMAHRLGIPFSHRAAYIGDPAVEQYFSRLVNEVSGHERLWVVDSTEKGEQPSLDDVKMLIAQFSPDMVLIDGISLLRWKGSRASEWEKMKENAYGLKQYLTSTSIAGLVAHQSSNTARGKTATSKTQAGRGDDWRMPSLNDAAFGDAFVQAMSTVITMCADEHRPDIRWYSVRKVRERQIDFSTLKYALLWNVDAGQLDDLSEYGDDMSLIAQHVQRQAVAG